MAKRGRKRVRLDTDERIDLYLSAEDYDALCRVARVLFENNVRGTAQRILSLGITAASNRVPLNHP